jgi:hypothetical protein
MRAGIPVLLICAGLAAGCASNSSPPPAGGSSSPSAAGRAGRPTAPSGTVSAAVATAPETAAAAKSTATLFLDLYAAGQYSATYAMLSPSAKRVISKRTWIRVHQACKAASGASYKVTQPVLTGSNAAVQVSAAGTYSDLGGDHESFIYRGGHWCFVVPDLSLYRHQSATQVTAELEAMNECG